MLYHLLDKLTVNLGYISDHLKKNVGFKRQNINYNKTTINYFYL